MMVETMLQLQKPRVEEGVAAFVERAFKGKMPAAIPFCQANASVLTLATHLKRHNSGSPKTLYQYVNGILRFSRWLQKSPDEMVKECQDADGDPVLKKVLHYGRLLDDFAGCLQDEKLAPGTINNHVKGAKQLFHVNGLKVELPNDVKLSKRVIYQDHSPRPETVQRLIDLADPRGRVIVSFLTLGGFREETLSLLKYRHVKQDLEAGVVPLHVHVESEIVKGKYCDYDTFLGGEAVDYLKIYLDNRRNGESYSTSKANVDKKTPPETITDNSPLIRNDNLNRRTGEFDPITPGRIWSYLHDLYAKAGLIKNDGSVRYELRVHTLRKFFKTQLIAGGVQESYVEYYMGHKSDTYNDVQGLDIEFHRNIYATSNLCIRPKTALSKLDAAKQLVRSLGLNPEKPLTSDAQAFPHRTFASGIERDEHSTEILAGVVRNWIRQESAGKGGVN
jgi:site-specific recombinase XerD